MEITVIVKIAVIGILTTIANMLLKKAGRDDIASVVSIVGLILALVILIDMIAGLYDILKSMFDI